MGMLDPYTVLDFTDARGELGPMILGDLGADVIKVEPPGGSSARKAEPLLEDAADADLASLQFVAFNRNKRSIVLDPEDDADRANLRALIERADMLIEATPDGPLAHYGINFEAARAINPRIVYVRLSPFGDDGPHADFIGNDLVIAAMGGPVSLQGSADRAPLRVTVPQVWRHAGIESAAAALVAHAKMRASGEAQYVDLSAQCVMTWTMLNAMDAHAIQGYDFERNGSCLNNGVLNVELVHPCVDGHIVALPLFGVLSGLTEELIEQGIVDESFRDTDWESFEAQFLDPSVDAPFNLDEATEICRRYFKNYTKVALMEYGLKHGMSFAPVNTLAGLLDLEHIKTRDYWRDVTLANGKTVGAAGVWAKPNAAPLTVRRDAPRLDEHGDEIRAELASTHDANTRDEDLNPDRLPFEGVKVADFAWVGVGPISAKYLADHGASVVRVESENRPDVLRGGGPFKDAQPGWNRSQFFGDFNTSKQSLSLDLKSPEAIELAKRLIAKSDVMIESFAPGAVARMGLGYDEVKQINPGLIMVSTCLMGQTGPASSMAGYGYHAASIAGFYELTGWPDQPPAGPWVAYTDTIAPRFISALLAAALDHKRRTGEGCYIDVAQLEAALHFLGPELLDYQANGRLASRLGNRSAIHAPQSNYPCAGEDQWVAIAVDDDTQWPLLCAEIGRADLAQDEALATHAGRLARHDDIDEAIVAWTRTVTPQEAMRRLQAAGVPAGVVQRSSDLLADPQYQHRRFYRWHDHPEMGHIPYAGHQYRISGYDNGPRAPAPTLGQHSLDVLTNLLDLDDEAIAAAYASGAIN